MLYDIIIRYVFIKSLEVNNIITQFNLKFYKKISRAPLIVMLTEDFLRKLYINSSLNFKNPKLQLLNFQQSQTNTNEIMVRLSDGKSFIDSPLSGPYKLINQQIVSEELYQTNKIIKKYDIVTIDYFSKIDQSKMCNLQLIIRKIETDSVFSHIIGGPQEISQNFENQGISNNIYPFLSNPQFTQIKMQNMQNINLSNSTQNWSINSLLTSSIKSEVSSADSKRKSKGKNQPNENSQTQSSMGSQNFLDLQQIESNKQGLFIGRLVRMKSGIRQLKQGGNFITVLYLAFIDLKNNLVRISLVGKNALRQQQQLMKYQVYTIKGIQNTSLDRTRFIYYLKLKDRQYNIKRVIQQPYVSMLGKYCFHFDHQPAKTIVINDDNQVQVVDVIGLVDQIQDKITYKNIHSFQEQRQVVRVTIRNALKSIKISFWAEQIKVLQTFQIKRYDQVILCDVKKKKNIFLDFTIQSNIINLKDQPQLRELYAPLFPMATSISQPQCLKSLLQYLQIQSNRSKIQHVKAYLTKIYENKIIFKICQDCKKKIQKEQDKCRECGCRNVQYKFNCLMDFVDHSASLRCVSFDPTTQKILGKSANQIQQMDEQAIKQYFQQFYYNQYEIGIQNKNDRYVLRNIQVFDRITEQTNKNLEKINAIKNQKDFIWTL